MLESISSHTKQIDSLLNLFLGKEDKRQGIVRNPESSVVNRLNNANRYIRSRPEGITATEEKLLKHAQNELQKALEQTNTFYDQNWEAIKREIEAVELSDFQSITRFDLD